MRSSRLVLRFARELFDRTDSSEQRGRVIADVRTAIERLEAKEALSMSVTKGLDATVVALLETMEREEALAQLPLVLRAFQRLRHQRDVVHEAVVTTAIPLDATRQKRVRSVLQAQWKGEFELSFKVDPRVKGGLLLATESFEFDATVQGRLRRFAHHLASLT